MQKSLFLRVCLYSAVEPGSYSRPSEEHPSPQQIGKDFASLVKVIRSFPNLQNSRIVGPDVNIDIGNIKSFDSQCIIRCPVLYLPSGIGSDKI